MSRASRFLLSLAFLLPASGFAKSPASHRHPCLQAAKLDFGNVRVGARADSVLKVKNRCSHPVTLTKVLEGSPSFSAALPGPIRIKARGTGSVPVAFTPADSGKIKTTLALVTSHPRRTSHAVLAGRGVAVPASALVVTPASVSLGMGPAEMDTFRLSITNPGTEPRAEILVDAIGPALPRPARGWRVLYLNTTMPSFWDDQLITLVRTAGNLDTVEAWYAADSLPPLARMLEYDVVMVASQSPWADGAGDRLADYLEAGGKVLLGSSALSSSGGIHGRIVNDYSPVGHATTTAGSASASLESHPITAGVDGFASGGILGVTSTRGQGLGIPLGTYANGSLVGAYHPDKPLVFLNVGSYEHAGDLPRLFANTFDYLGGMMAWATPRPPFDPVIFVVPVGETRELTVAVHSHRLPAGTHIGAIQLHNVSDTDAVPMDIPVTLEVAAGGRLAVDPETWSFGPTWQGSRATRPVRLVNPGNAPISVSGFAASAPDFSLSASLPLEIPAFSHAIVEAAYAPTTLGSAAATVEVHSDAQEPVTPTIALEGEGIVPPILSVTPEGFQVTLPEGQGGTETLSIRNPGGDSLKLAFRAVVDAAGGRPATGPEVMDVLYVHTTTQSYENSTDFFMWTLLADPRIGTLTGFQASDSLPSLDYMRQFDAVLVVSAEPWADAEVLGDRLADYVDGGGRVCLMHAALVEHPGLPGFRLGGRIATPDYSPVAPAGTMGVGYVDRFTDNPITEGIAMDALWSDWTMNAQTLNPNSHPLGWYTTGALVGAYKLDKAVAFLNVWPLDGYNHPPTTAQLIGNALEWLARTYDWFMPGERTLALGPGEEAALPLHFGQPFLPGAGSYTGRLEIHHNAPGTGTPLEVPVQLTVEGAAATTSVVP